QFPIVKAFLVSNFDVIAKLVSIRGFIGHADDGQTTAFRGFLLIRESESQETLARRPTSGLGSGRSFARVKQAISPFAARPCGLIRSPSEQLGRIQRIGTANGKSLSASRRNTTTTSPKSSSSSGPTPPPEASTSSSTNGPPKQQLLSAEQKKLNHIHSEQKRRANIRRGYDALCDVVPALREAIKAEEAECVNTGKKRGRGKLLGEDGEKMDGRAGPRSESVVLQKTIEHIDDLMAQRSSYLERLRAAKAALPPGHPALLGTSQGEQPWEKIWNGGIGLPLGGDPMDADGDPMYQDGYDDDGGSEED
ncbi:hypothetical protein FRC00_000528, partial [Tulasnella sp. 408]